MEKYRLIEKTKKKREREREKKQKGEVLLIQYRHPISASLKSRNSTIPRSTFIPTYELRVRKCSILKHSTRLGSRSGVSRQERRRPRACEIVSRFHVCARSPAYSIISYEWIARPWIYFDRSCSCLVFALKPASSSPSLSYRTDSTNQHKSRLYIYIYIYRWKLNRAFSTWQILNEIIKGSSASPSSQMFRSSNPRVNYFVFDPFRGTRHTFRNLEHACTKEDLFSRGRNGNDLHTSDGERVIYGGAAYGIDGQKRKEREGKGERENVGEDRHH